MNIRAILHALAWALASSAALADAQVYSPLPVQLGTGPQQASSGALALFPGDNHGSMGRTHVVFKVNNAIWFYNRQASQFTTPAPIADASFWPPAPGATSFTPKGDGRVIYDPYEPAACPGGGGRWILAEMGVMNYSSSTCAAFAYRDHVTGGNLELPFIYKYGQAPYTAGPGGGSSRTGDYGHSNPDPGDDTTFFTTAGFAGSQFTGTQNYGWQSGWALVKPPPIRFVGYQDAETEIIKCPAAPGFFGVYNCTVTLTPPSGTQPGDVLAVTLDALLPYSEPAVPAAWTTLPAINQANAVSITSTQGGYLPEREWLLVHQYGNSEPPAYSFSVNVTLGSDSQGHYFGGQLGAFLVSYRGASGNFADYVANGYPSSAVSSTVSLGPIAPVANRQLVALFRGGSDDPSGGSPFSGPWGYPPLTGQTPRALPVNVINMLGADLWTANFVGFDYGAYTSPVSPGPGQTSAAGTVMGWLLFMPPK